MSLTTAELVAFIDVRNAVFGASHRISPAILVQQLRGSLFAAGGTGPNRSWTPEPDDALVELGTLGLLLGGYEAGMKMGLARLRAALAPTSLGVVFAVPHSWASTRTWTSATRFSALPC